MTHSIVPFTDKLVPQAASLLASRHHSDRTILPFLSGLFENVDEAGRCIRVLMEEKKSNGFAVLKDDLLRAFLLGDVVYGPIWGRTGWVRAGGWALDSAADTEVIRELYAALGEQWVSRGIFAHFAVIPATGPEILRTWVTLSFGIEQVYAVTDLSVAAPSGHGSNQNNASGMAPDIEIRRAGHDDRETLANISDIIWRHQTRAPVWGVKPPETVEEVRKSWAGYRYCITDWRSTNLQASRFWPRFGFRPVGYRLVRRIDGRIAVAGGG